MATFSATLILLVAQSLFGSVASTCTNDGIDCTYEVGPWSTCDPCKFIRSRSVIIKRARHGEGYVCPNEPVQFETCIPSKGCSPPTCDETAFVCTLTGKCVPPYLVCNGEDDCGDYSDEFNCSKEAVAKHELFDKQCASLSPVPYLDLPGSGVDVVTGQTLGLLLDNSLHLGLCRTVRDSDSPTVYRLPFNMDAMHFQVVASDVMSTQSYSSHHEYQKRVEGENDEKFDSGVDAGGKLWSVSVKVAQSHNQYNLDIFKEMSSSESKLFQVSSHIELAQFQLKQRNMLLDTIFHQTILRLPVEYNAKVYYDFVKQFGTHYVSSGKLGGKYEYFYTFASSEMKKENFNENKVKNCLKVEESVKVFRAKQSTSYEQCKTKDTQISTSDYASSMATKTISNVVGGTSSTAAILASSNDDPQKFAQWISSVKMNPAVLALQYRPMCDLIRDSGIRNATIIRQNCEQATYDYLNHYNPSSSCRSCQNNGVAVNIQQTCYCSCPDGSIGQVCQQFEITKSLAMPEHNPFPMLVRKSAVEQKVTAMRAGVDRVFGLTNDGNIVVYTHENLHSVATISPPQGMKASIGLDVDADRRIWTFNEDDESLIRMNDKGELLMRIVKDDISNYCWKPSDLTTTCKTDELVITDGCNRGRIFVLSIDANASTAAVKQYIDKGSGELPLYVTHGPDDSLLVTTEHNITVYRRSSVYKPYELAESWPHLALFPGQIYMDETGYIFMSCSFNIPQTKNYALFQVFRKEIDGSYQKKPTTIETDLWSGGCVGLAGTGSYLYSSCRSLGLLIYRTI